MKTIGVTDLRQRTAEVLAGLPAAAGPVAILQRSRKIAYLVEADLYDALQAELAAARRALFVREARDADAEYREGARPVYDDVDRLIADLDLDA